MNLQEQYTRLEGDRQLYVDSAKACAEVTIPGLFPREDTPEARMITPWQALGSDGVTSLSAKLAQVLFPSNAPFFRLTMSQEELKELNEELQQAAQGNPEAFEALKSAMKEQTDAILAQYEMEAIKVMESRGDRPKHYQILQQLILAGNCLFKDTRVSREFSVHKLDSFVTKRDDTGKILKVILREAMSRESILEIPGAAESKDLMGFLEKDVHKDATSFDVYTGAILKDGKYMVTQQLAAQGGLDAPYELTSATFDEDDLPIRPLRLYSEPGECYSRSYVSQFLGDLKTLEGLYQATAETAAVAAKLIWGVEPNSQTLPDDVTNAVPGQAITAHQGDVFPISSEGKMRDMQTAYHLIDRLEQRIGKVFLLHSAIQRDAERVTAAEITALIKELENQLGGIYSLLSQEFQRPYVKHLLDSISSFPKLPKGSVDAAIVTGADALGRTEELARVDHLIQRAMALPQGAQYVKTGEVLMVAAKSIGVLNPMAVLKTDQEVQAEVQAQMQAAQQAALEQEAMKGAAKPAAEAALAPPEPEQ